MIFLNAFIIIFLGLALVTVEPTIGGIVLLFGLLAALPALIVFKTSEFGVTNKRVIIKVGLVRRRTLELLLGQVEAISVDQDILGRIFGFGEITLTGTGGIREVFNKIGKPLEFRRQIQSQII